jgi:hypothetical protein
MSLTPAPASDLSNLLRAMLDGDLTAAKGALDCLAELPERREDWCWLRERLGALAAANFGLFYGDESTAQRRKKFRAQAVEDHAMSEASWQSFAEAVAARFWFDLYDADATLAALTESWNRVRRFGFRPA